MIHDNDHLYYKDVYSKTYTFAASEIGRCIQAFWNTAVSEGLRPIGPFFFSMYWLGNRDEMRAEFFITAKSDGIYRGALKYQNVFVIENMISTMVFDHFETNVSKAYKSLIAETKKRKQRIASPFYHVVCRHEKGACCIIKMAVVDDVKKEAGGFNQ